MECMGLDRNGCRHNNVKSQVWYVCDACDADFREEVKQKNKSIARAKELAGLAIVRASQGLKYGDDMRSSTKVCLQDAAKLLQDALEDLENNRI